MAYGRHSNVVERDSGIMLVIGTAVPVSDSTANVHPFPVIDIRIERDGFLKQSPVPPTFDEERYSEDEENEGHNAD
jgi:hypothetical protein